MHAPSAHSSKAGRCNSATTRGPILDLGTLATGKIVDELMTNHDFIAKISGVDSRPYFRPPNGYRDGHVDAAAAAVGFDFD